MQTQIREVVTAARTWMKTREKWRRAHDSKTAKPAEVETAKAAFSKASDALEKAVVSFEKALKKRPRNGKPIAWGKLFEAVAVGAKALERAVGTPPGIIEAEVIDVTDSK